MNLSTAARAANLIEDAETGEFVGSASDAKKAAGSLGLTLDYSPQFEDREWALLLKNCKLIAKVRYEEKDEAPGSRFLKKNKRWSACLGTVSPDLPDSELAEIDALVRYRRTDDAKGVGWSVRQSDKSWTHNIDSHLVGCVLKAHGHQAPEIIKGNCVRQPWHQRNIPFVPEEPGNRVWNLDSAQYVYKPVPGPYPHWQLILDHCGAGLPDGAEYLLKWIAWMLRHPFQQLPYLFLYSATQNNGKSSLHEAIALLMTKGVASADRALTNNNDFNGELANAVLAYIEEKDVSKSPGAYNKLKDWVTSPTIWIRKMHTTAFAQQNTLHFIQTANDPGACPVFPGDTRITMIHVPDLKDEIPKTVLLDLLRQEAPAFMHRVLTLDLPPVVGRLALPVVDTEFKRQQMEASVSDFIRAIGDYMADKKTAKLFATGFQSAFGTGDWPPTIREVRKEIATAGPYFRKLGIKVDFGKREEGGVPLMIHK